MRWASRIVTRLMLVLALATIFTAKPGDAALYPAKPGDAHVVYLVSHGWHSGLVLPRDVLTGRDSGAALRTVAEKFRDFPMIEFGWGEAEFYRATPTVADLDWGLGLKALFTPGGREGVVQVVGLPNDLREAFPRSDIVPLTLSGEGLRRLLTRLEASFRLLDHQPVDAGPGLYGAGRFFAATGRFSFWNLCNHWAADLLNAAGLPIAPVLATLPRGLILDLEWRAGATPLPLTPPA